MPDLSRAFVDAVVDNPELGWPKFRSNEKKSSLSNAIVSSVSELQKLRDSNLYQGTDGHRSRASSGEMEAESKIIFSGRGESEFDIAPEIGRDSVHFGGR